jgi:D-alanyl-D-alanine carboxypeptidase/D-alanyl-D-alanine-endopeptidase (penicillin-binding protein 4)
MKLLMLLVAPPSKHTIYPPLQLRLFATLVTLFFLCTVASAVSESVPPKLQQKIEQAIPRGVEVGIYVLDAQRGDLLFSLKGERTLKPASVLKVATSYAALKAYGPQYTIQTRFYGERKSASALKRLTIVGAGDPSLTIEGAWIAARALALRGITQIDEVALDATAFLEEKKVSGARAYETGSSALSFNHNSIGISVCPGSKVGEKALARFAPWEWTPGTLTNRVVTAEGQQVSLGVEVAKSSYAVSGRIGIDRACSVRYRSISNPPIYFGETFIALLKSVGISVTRGEPFVIKVLGQPIAGEVLYEHQSKPIKGLLEDLNHFSNNFIGEQLLYLIGSDNEKTYSRERGLEALTDYGDSLGIPREEIFFDDGSGLSHDNRLSPRAVATFFYHAMRSPQFGVEFLNSLSVGGESGTLKDRDFGENNVVRGKTGTLTGVSSLVGTMTTASGRQVIFSIIENKLSSKDQGLALENRVVHTVYDEL